MVVNMLISASMSILNNMALFMRPPAHKPLNKMVQLSEKFAIFLKLHVLYSMEPTYKTGTGQMQLLLLYIYSTGCPPKS